MKTVTKYVAKDGCEFTSKTACAKHEALIVEVDEIMKALIPAPKDNSCDFANGGGYIQQNEQVVCSAWKKLHDLSTPYCSPKGEIKWWADSADMTKCHPSWVDRFVSECCPNPLALAVRRMNNISTKSWREYGQPYFANNEHEAKNVDWTKKKRKK